MLQKISAATATATLTAIIFSLPDETQFTEVASENFKRIFKLSAGDYYFYSLVAVLILFFVSSIVRSHSGGKNQKLFFLASIKEKVAALLNFLLGIIWVPLVVVSTVLLNDPQDHNVVWVLFMLSQYFLIGVGVYLLMHFDNFPYEAITYFVWSKKMQNHELFSRKTSERLGEVVSHVDFIARPITCVQVYGGSATIVLPSHLIAEAWLDPQLLALKKYLDAIELEWKLEGLEFESNITPRLRDALSKAKVQVK